MSRKALGSAAELSAAGRRHQWLALGFDESYFDHDPIIVANGEGPYLVDVSGDRYIDALTLQSAGVLGHNHPRVMEAMREQMDGGMVGNIAGVLPSDRSIELATRLSELADGELTRAFFMLSGSDANDTAIKLARQYWKNRGRGSKFKTIVRRNGYHGATLATNAASGNNRYPHSAFEPLPSGFVHVGSPYSRECTYCDGRCDSHCADQVAEALRYEDPESVACVLVEGTMGVAGILTPPEGYFARLREICDAHDVLLIVDEVVTAMGRAGTWFEYQREGILPDVAVLAKVLTAGHMPLGALLAREEVASAFQGPVEKRFIAGTTLGGTPLACAAALATIEVVEEEKLAERALWLGEQALPRLNALAERSRIVADVRVRGPMMAIEWEADAEKGTPFTDVAAVKALAVQLGRERGVHFYGGPPQSLIAIPPSNIGESEFEQILDAFDYVVAGIERDFPA